MAQPSAAKRGEAHPCRVEVSVPGLGEQKDTEQGQCRPGQGSSGVGADGRHGQRAEELDRDCRAQGNALDGGEERDGDQAGGDTEPDQRWYVVPAHLT